MEQVYNPYAAPTAAVDGASYAEDEFQPVRLFSTAGRIASPSTIHIKSRGSRRPGQEEPYPRS